MIGILVMGILSQWVAWLLRIPSILLLLLAGFIAGPLTGFLNPDVLLGELLFPFVSLSVAIILFEGGLTLKFSELKKVGVVVRNLVSIGALITWVLVALAAWFFLKFSVSLSILLGAILVVTGPTVIVPILRHLRLTGHIGPLLKWEAITIDPIGVVLSVLVFEALITKGWNHAASSSLLGFLGSLGVGAGFGALAGVFMVFMMKRYWIPDYLQSVTALTCALAAFGLSNSILEESGLVAVTLMGAYLANQKHVSIKSILEFKENLRVILISTLFIILAARLEMRYWWPIPIESIYFLLTLLFIVRPVSVMISSIGSGLKWKEKLFISWMAPRGIVAAATASIFALSLEHAGFQDTDRLVSITFFTIISTVAVYGLTSPWMAYMLKVANPNPQGVVLLGAHPWMQELAIALKSNGIRVLLVDTNAFHVRSARKRGLPVVAGNILSEEFTDRLDLSGIGYFMGMTSNDEVNALGALHFSKILGSQSVFQLSDHKGEVSKNRSGGHAKGRILFNDALTYERFTEYFSEGCIKCYLLDDDHTQEAFAKEYGNRASILFAISKSSELKISTTDSPIKPIKGDTLVYALKA